MTIREEAAIMMMSIEGNNKNPEYPYMDILPSVRRAKQAAGMTLACILLPLKSGYCVMVLILLSDEIHCHPVSLSIMFSV